MAGMKPTAYSYIRFSTPEQTKGDSLRRQVELSETYAEKHGLNLDLSLTIRDLGVSAYDSSNITKGALGVFLQGAKAGRIPSGSYLLIESLDRLSRAQVLTALKIFISILDEGIIICTLTDSMQYSRESVDKNFSELLISLTIMSRAHEESKMKSLRLSAVWKKKRDNLSIKKFSAHCPYWLTLNREKNRFDVVDANAKTVNYIFELAASGLGNFTIVKRLNTEGVGNFGRAAGWCTSSIQAMVNNRAVLGEFQPHTKVNKKRIPEGDPIVSYYPAIVSEELFYRVQTSRKSRNQSSYAGAKGVSYANLFSGYCKCAYCGGPMNFFNKGSRLDKEKRWKYLTCQNAKNGMDCDTTHIPYPAFESGFLADLPELDLSKVFNDGNDAELAKLKIEHNVVSGQLNDTKSKLQKLMDLMMESDDLPRSFIAKAQELEAQQETLEAKFRELTGEIAIR